MPEPPGLADRLGFLACAILVGLAGATTLLVGGWTLPIRPD